MTFFAAYLVKEAGLAQAEAGRMWAMVGALSIFCGLIWGGLSDKLGRSKGASLAYLVLGISYAILGLGHARAAYYVSSIVFGITAWSVPVIMAAAAGDYVGPRLAPAGLGFITLFFGIGQALGPSLAGYLADLTHSFTGPLLLACGISFAGAALALGLKRVGTESVSASPVIQSSK